MEFVARVFAESAPRLLAFLWRLGANSDEAEEALSYAFETLVRAVRAGRPPHTNPESFVFTVAKRRLYAQWAQRAREVGLDEQALVLAARTEDSAVAERECQLAAAAFLALHPQARAVLWRVLCEGVSQQALAAEMGISASTLRKRVSRYRQQMREQFHRLCAQSETWGEGLA
ncbi:RNA polymerase sigma factor [Leucobacter sp. 7(1)]|uniref:RNA polymerase sigma factor n=1 Tax=Leucobacter sp. 7(1) TaxID=1255613 RepID=UPI000B357EDF|nr:RNA polymerase sigma factor [Leucobacter sp. 7(1)]